ncbi:MAG: T9SS type A sorting domain-containing protein [Bacteroidota bacterium]
MKFLHTICLLFLLVSTLSAQKNVRTFVFGHSLINHEFQVNPTPSQETSVPHWFYYLAEAAGYDYAVGGQFGFLPQHTNLPPIAQWGFDVVPGAWESDYEPFVDAGFTNILITPANFAQWQAPDLNYPNETVSPVSATNTVFDWCLAQDENLTFFIYENWPDMAPYLGSGFPPNATEWDNYNDYLLGDFHEWFLEYYDLVQSNFPNACIRMIPVGPTISKLLQQAPFDQIPIDQLYEDDAPHGRPSIYFLASIATYMAMYEEKPVADFAVDPIIHPIIADNYQAVVDFFWEELLAFNDSAGSSQVFCNSITSTTVLRQAAAPITLFPNPATHQTTLQGIPQSYSVELYDFTGKAWPFSRKWTPKGLQLDTELLPAGIYWIAVRNEQYELIGQQKLLKSNN